NIIRRPRESPSAPPTKIRAERNSPYDSITHCKSTTVAPRLDCSAGRATLTTVLSINAMLEPRMVAVSTQQPDFSGQRTPGVLPGMTASAHGCLILNVDAYGLRMDSAPLDSRSDGDEGRVILSPMKIWTKPLARRTLPRARMRVHLRPRPCKRLRENRS